MASNRGSSLKVPESTPSSALLFDRKQHSVGIVASKDALANPSGWLRKSVENAASHTDRR
jgi:hypothetical protein